MALQENLIAQREEAINRTRDLEQQLAYEKERNANNVAIADERINVLERQLATAHEDDRNQVNEIVRLQDELAKYKLKWQTGKPPKDGYYWKKSGQSIWMDSIYPESNPEYEIEMLYWAGPIPMPEEEKCLNPNRKHIQYLPMKRLQKSARRYR